MSSCYIPYFWCVGEDERAVVTACGKFKYVKGPGAACFMPYVHECDGVIKTRTCSNHRDCVCKTQDDVFVNIRATIMYRVDEKDVYDAHYSLRNPQKVIEAFTANVLRNVVPTLTVDELFASASKVAAEIKQQLVVTLAEHGYTIEDVLITRLQPDPKVRYSMNHINATRRLRIAAVAKAEALVIERVVEAEANAEAMFLTGKGISDQRAAIIAGMEESVTAIEQCKQLSAKDAMELILMTQYFDTMKELAHCSTQSTLFMPHNIGTVHDIGKNITSQASQKSLTL